MTHLRTVLLAAVASGALCASASALPLSSVPGQEPSQEPSLLQNAAVVCNDRGRCYETRQHIYRDYDEDVYVGPRHRYYREEPGVGLRFRFGDRWR